MGVKHAFTNPKSDGADATITRPSDWNADHVITSFALPGDISPAQLTANQDDWAPTGLADAAVIRASTDASRNLTGITGGADGRVLVLANVGAFDLVLVHDATSTAANRFFCPNNVNYTMRQNSAVELVYDSTSSRWRVREADGSIVTHEAAADPHTGYRLESADHSHASTGLQAGQLDHGTALTGLTDDDHTQYRLESESGVFTVGAVFEGAPPSNGARRIWSAPFACTVTDIQVLVIGGTSATVNAQRNTVDLRSADATVNAATDYASAGGTLQNTDFASGDDCAVEIVSTSGAVTFVGIQVNFTRP